MIRPATADDLPVLRDVERAAGEAFRQFGMPEIADDEPLPLDVLDAYRRAGRAWVAVDEVGAEPAAAHVGAEPAAAHVGPPVAYLIADVVDGCLHIEQVSVHPRAARQGIGRRLIEHAALYARQHGLAGLTLTTFADVPWNAPYYERCGFRVVPDEELTPGLRAVRRNEAAHGLDRWPRVVMHRPAGN
ncbi:GNAT family N-acetyltransferase [Virgisporangium ochraceum]|uniref:GCN5 family N-acetyltransferase n=1 Tax=Virgisporangium ochraceum TaxID=65505 RepID=A0A8J4EAC2_9ACTN|nr:GNAT family N-acetyltransferase [Virgisporangium ochraceum]GIJ67258.1 GCN5 family N-acetyltransferase [Virgisporangium ochraceum]